MAITFGASAASDPRKIKPEAGTPADTPPESVPVQPPRAATPPMGSGLSADGSDEGLVSGLQSTFGKAQFDSSGKITGGVSNRNYHGMTLDDARARYEKLYWGQHHRPGQGLGPTPAVSTPTTTPIDDRPPIGQMRQAAPAGGKTRIDPTGTSEAWTGSRGEERRVYTTPSPQESLNRRFPGYATATPAQRGNILRGNPATREVGIVTARGPKPRDLFPGSPPPAGGTMPIDPRYAVPGASNVASVRFQKSRMDPTNVAAAAPPPAPVPAPATPTPPMPWDTRGVLAKATPNRVPNSPTFGVQKVAPTSPAVHPSIRPVAPQSNVATSAPPSPAPAVTPPSISPAATPEQRRERAFSNQAAVFDIDAQAGQALKSAASAVKSGAGAVADFFNPTISKGTGLIKTRRERVSPTS